MTESSTYAVAWREGAARFVGHAELRGDRLRLEGRGPEGNEGLRTIPVGDIAGVEVQRVNGSRGIALALPHGVLLITSLDRLGSLAELADRLRKLTDSPQR